ncbi:MAG: tetratricopeptide repeat protein, partial [Betaproteobacteria bacterium]|nr:tetratricopeptide repeat protein [Betaproteobacteria bacterium]
MKKFIAAILCGLLFLALPALGNSRLATEQTHTAKTAHEVPDLSVVLKLQEHDLENFRKRLDSQDGRIADIGLYLTCFGMLIAVLVVSFSLIGFVSVKNRARDEAKTESKKWFADNERRLTAQIDDLQERVKKLGDDTEANIKSKEKAFEAALEEARRQIQQRMSEPGKNTQPILQETIDELTQAEQSAIKKPEADYTYEDWNNRAFAAYSRDDKAGAMYFWMRASHHPAATAVEIASGLFNSGFALEQMERNEEAVTIYEEVVQRFGSESEVALRELVAKALVNKGFTLAKLDRDEEAIAVYDEVVRRFGEATEAALREKVVMALVNKGFVLGKLDRSEEEIACYDEVVRRFGEATETALREQVAMALFNKGGTLGKLDRGVEGIACYDEVVRRFGEATEVGLREQVAKALVNKGFTLGKLGRDEEEISACDEVVRRFGEATETALREQVAMALFNK